MNRNKPRVFMYDEESDKYIPKNCYKTEVWMNRAVDVYNLLVRLNFNRPRVSFYNKHRHSSW